LDGLADLGIRPQSGYHVAGQQRRNAVAAFKQAQWYHEGRRGYNGDGRIHGVVVHSMEAPEKGTTAEAVATYFANGSGGRPSSADWCFDSNSEVECVRATDEAYHAPPASRWTRGYEHAGYARQTAQDWHDPFSWAMLRRSAVMLGKESQRFKFPIRYLSVADLKAGRIDGVTTHDAVSKAFGKSSHWDPGPGFPMTEWLKMARDGIHTVAPPPATSGLRRGDSGPAVGFLQAMLNIAAPVRINAYGKSGGQVLDINEANPEFGIKTEAAVMEFERFQQVMWMIAGAKGTPPKVDGIADQQVASGLAFWIPIILADPKYK
jgi:hypothetical protein